MPLNRATSLAPHDAVGLAGVSRCPQFRRRMLVAAALAGLGVVLLAVDLPVARWFRAHRLPGDLGRLVDLSEVFAHGLGVAVLLAVTVALDPVLRRVATARGDIVRLVAAAYAGGLAVDAIKLVVTRVRPRAADLTAVASVLGTFGSAAVTGEVEGGGLTGKSSALMSFPSGHAATAAGLATALCWKYPHGIPVFAALAAAVGIALAAICLGCSRPARGSPA